MKERRSPIVITQNGKAVAVVQDVDTYERQRRALMLLKIVAMGERDYEEGRTMSIDEAERRLKGRFREKEPEE